MSLVAHHRTSAVCYNSVFSRAYPLVNSHRPWQSSGLEDSFPSKNWLFSGSNCLFTRRYLFHEMVSQLRMTWSSSWYSNDVHGYTKGDHPRPGTRLEAAQGIAPLALQRLQRHLQRHGVHAAKTRWYQGMNIHSPGCSGPLQLVKVLGIMLVIWCSGSRNQTIPGFWSLLIIFDPYPNVVSVVRVGNRSVACSQHRIVITTSYSIAIPGTP